MEEPTALIRWTVFIFAGGIAGIAGAIGIAAVAIDSLSPNRRRRVRPFQIAVVVAVGLILIVCGSLPLPIWFQLATLVWLAFVLWQRRIRTVQCRSPLDQPAVSSFSIPRTYLFLSPFVWPLTLIVIELPFQLWFVPTERVSTLLVIGDSVTAGLNDGEDTWPRQLSRAAEIDVLDASQPGATLRSARQQNSLLSNQPGLVVLEIGGNDMLEGLPVRQFESDLDGLLAEVTQTGRNVVMFELPLPPMCAAYGMAQRRQAAKHRVGLIPKRLFASVLTTSGATVDGIHLSIRGQKQMMELVRTLFGAQIGTGRGSYQHLERN